MVGLPNLILLSVDALRADHLSSQGYHRETTPTIDGFAEDNLNFTSTYAPSSHTREAAPPILTGQYPEAFAANGFQQIEETLPVKLRDCGYHTGAFHSNPYLSRAYGYDTGFDHFYDDLYFAQHRWIALAQKAIDKYLLQKGEYYARAPEIHRRALDWLDDANEPFFLWNHYMDVHGPYHAPEREFASRSISASEAEDLYRKSWERPEEVTEDERQLLIDSYDDEIRCLDREISRFLGILDDRGLLEDALLVITSDHGDAFGENGYYTHPRRLDQALLHVPLLISTPDDHLDEIDSPVSTIDVAPTLADFAGLETESFPGAPLVDQSGILEHNPERPVFASVTPDSDDQIRRFAVHNGESFLRQERNVETGQIRSEVAEVVGENTDSDVPDEVRKEMAQFAQERLEALGSTDIATEPDTTAEIESRLEALGYK